MSASTLTTPHGCRGDVAPHTHTQQAPPPPPTHTHTLPHHTHTYTQGTDEAFDGDTRGTSGNDTIGQAFTMTFHVILRESAVPQPDNLPPMDSGWAPNPFRASPAIHTPNNRLDWASLWTRRRSYHSFAPPRPPTTPHSAAPNHRVGMDPPLVSNAHRTCWQRLFHWVERPSPLPSKHIAAARTMSTSSHCALCTSPREDLV
jgi:hypothetical protein